MELADETVYGAPVFLQKCPVATTSGNALRAPKIQVDSIAIWLNITRRFKQLIWLVGAELNEKRSVYRRVAIEPRFLSSTFLSCWLEVGISKFLCLGEKSCM